MNVSSNPDRCDVQGSPSVDRALRRADADALAERFGQALRRRQCADGTDHPAHVSSRQRERTERADSDTRGLGDRDESTSDATAAARTAAAAEAAAAMAARCGSMAANAPGVRRGVDAVGDAVGVVEASASERAVAVRHDRVVAQASETATDTVWSIQLPTLDNWSLQATSVHGRWDLTFVDRTTDAIGSAQATGSAHTSTLGGLDASTLSAQAEVLAQRLQEPGMPWVGSVDVATPLPHDGGGARDHHGQDDGRGDRRHAADPRGRRHERLE